jgi:hypothetical protein
MTQMIFYTHSGWRYLVLLISAIALIKFIISWIANSEWSKWDQWLLAGYAGVITVQWLLGIVLWIMYGFPTAGYFLEHIVTMTLAFIPAHMGLARTKRAVDSKAKYRTATIYTAISTALVWLGVARITGVL